MRATRLTFVGLALLAAVALGLATFALARPASGGDAAQRASYVAPSLFPSLSAPKRLTVAFIGDSYTAGAVVGEAQSWANVLGAANGWNVVNVARGGTGYVKGYSSGGQAACGGEVCPNYLQVVPQAVAAAPDVVIVAGGRNDGTVLTPDLEQNIKAVYTTLRKSLPNAKLIGLSPILAADDTPSSFPTVKPAVKQAVESVGGTHIDLGAPLGNHGELVGPDGVHPNVAGQKVLAATVGRLLPHLG
ncbi:SGNH/GDSL hydrolase family protein [Sinomonas susongensis]|uniref:SGNH/GDSL hydrolase family protein n=1 Tax=Sinomonas susongensis TaxID=1324851 RepID=UPI001109BA3E|nr:SGNH/GDSL hydrolase family protein [Sinomonas susongensis]